MNQDLYRWKSRRRESIGLSIALTLLATGPVFILHPYLQSSPAYMALWAASALVVAAALHSVILGPWTFRTDRRTGRGRRRVPAPVFRISDQSKKGRILVDQYLWNGWKRVHTDQRFESLEQMSAYLRHWVARSQSFVGPEFTGDDLLVIHDDVDTERQPLSIRVDTRTQKADSEMLANQRQLLHTRLSIVGAGAVLPWLVLAFVAGELGYTFSDLRSASPGAGLLAALGGSYALILAGSWTLATSVARHRWWKALMAGRRYVRYRIVRRAHDDRYWAQTFSVTEWRTKEHLNGMSLIEVEDALEKDVRELRSYARAVQERAKMVRQQAALAKPFSVDALSSDEGASPGQMETQSKSPFQALTKRRQGGGVKRMTAFDPLAEDGEWAEDPAPEKAAIDGHFSVGNVDESNVGEKVDQTGHKVAAEHVDEWEANDTSMPTAAPSDAVAANRVDQAASAAAETDVPATAAELSRENDEENADDSDAEKAPEQPVESLSSAHRQGERVTSITSSSRLYRRAASAGKGEPPDAVTETGEGGYTAADEVAAALGSGDRGVSGRHSAMADLIECTTR